MSKLADYNAKGPGAAEREMAAYGISKSSVDYFHYKQYRYTTLQEAVNQARRDTPAETGSVPGSGTRSATRPAARS